MSKIEEIRKRHQGWGDKPDLGLWCDFDSEKAHQDRAALLAALDGEWQSERPGPGSWNISVTPETRYPINGCLEYPWPAVAACEVIVGYDDTLHVQFCPGGEAFPLEQYTGALWQRRTVPKDPFAKGGE